MTSILIVFGTRPEAIKMAPILQLLKQYKISVKICVTGQQREMLDQVLKIFKIIPDYDLNLMTHNQSLNELSSRILIKIDKIFKKEKIDLVLVHGDTTTSSMAALAAFHRKIKIAHVEAGLRTYNKYAPFPEEINRQIISRIANIHFAPTNLAKQNLVCEKISEKQIVITGNTVIDAMYWVLNNLDESKFEVIRTLKRKLNNSKKIILVTGHRRENFGEGFKNICRALIILAKREDVEIVYPVHLNPNVQKTVFSLLKKYSNIHLINPVEYPVMIWLMKKCTLIISDSGGIQEEAPSLKKILLVTRDTTERPEVIENGFAVLVGTNVKKIVNEANFYLDSPIVFKNNKNPYGNGNASLKIIESIQDLLSVKFIKK